MAAFVRFWPRMSTLALRLRLWLQGNDLGCGQGGWIGDDGWSGRSARIVMGRVSPVRGRTLLINAFPAMPSTEK
ncbi:hypothetical protein CDV53_18135 [Haematobacter missouriensis]|uniref:Secreted protein n=1 Tax=Haematobacter missouriensis TaxID=366616 RepID=A0ABX3ZP63_9RHOB|nr:hypothetical protein CDV53_18135 [Haematobacter missouriensis]